MTVYICSTCHQAHDSSEPACPIVITASLSPGKRRLPDFRWDDHAETFDAMLERLRRAFPGINPFHAERVIDEWALSALVSEIDCLRADVLALTQPAAPSAPSELSRQVADALEKSKPLVAEALKLGRSISGPDPALAGVRISLRGRQTREEVSLEDEAPSAVPATCTTCGGARWLRTMEDDSSPCPDCAGRAH